MHRLSLFLKAGSASLIFIMLTNSTGYASESRLPNAAKNCGQWSIAGGNSGADQRIGITPPMPVTNSPCDAALTLQNQTGVLILGGGYALELRATTSNATFKSAKDNGGLNPILSPGLPLDFIAEPSAESMPASVSLHGDMTAGSYAVDLAFFLLKSISAFAPTGCLLPVDKGILVSFRVADVLINVARLAMSGNFIGSRQELQRVAPQFYTKAGDNLRDTGVHCVADFILAFGGPTVYYSTKVTLAYLAWIGVTGFDYLKYQGFSTSGGLQYSPAAPSNFPPPASPPSAPSPTASPTNPPSVSSLPGTVNQLSNCRYGPDYPYLYKYGVRAGTKMEVIGRDADGNWLQVRGVGGNNACWIKAVQIQVDGDVMGLPDAYPTTTGLPISPFFERITLTGVSSSGGAVNVSWLEHEIRSDLGTEQGYEYIVEVWTCVNGKPNFSAIGTNDTSASFQIDNSCGVPSHADVIGEDKEGFSVPTIITLP